MRPEFLLLVALSGMLLLLVWSAVAVWWGQFVARQYGPRWLWIWVLLPGGLLVRHLRTADDRLEYFAVFLVLGLLPAWRMARSLSTGTSPPFRRMYWRVAVPLLSAWLMFVIARAAMAG